MKNKVYLFLFAIAVIVGVFSYGLFSGEESTIEEQKVESVSSYKIIGTSVEGRSIDLYTYGSGGTHLVFVGGVHGGYEWNSILLSYELIDYLDVNIGIIPQNITVSVIPSLNPDGLFEAIQKEGRFTLSDVPNGAGEGGVGRFNANSVDLNRNFDCKWSPESMWRGNVVGTGSVAFSEPEAQALKKFVDDNSPTAVIFFHSKANTVYASECKEGVLPETIEIMNMYADAAGYNKVESFDAYPITGDAEGWLASIGIPAITVELKTHETVEWEQNLLGIKALFDYYK